MQGEGGETATPQAVEGPGEGEGENIENIQQFYKWFSSLAHGGQHEEEEKYMYVTHTTRAVLSCDPLYPLPVSLLVEGPSSRGWEAIPEAVRRSWPISSLRWPF